jgi:hypothetical protein
VAFFGEIQTVTIEINTLDKTKRSVMTGKNSVLAWCKPTTIQNNKITSEDRSYFLIMEDINMSKKKSLEQVIEAVTEAKEQGITKEYVDIQYVYQLLDAVTQLKLSQCFLTEEKKKCLDDRKKMVEKHNALLETVDILNSEKQENIKSLTVLTEGIQLYTKKLNTMKMKMDRMMIDEELKEALGLQEPKGFGKIFDIKG